MPVRSWMFKLLPLITLLQRLALAEPGSIDDSSHLRKRTQAHPCPQRGAVCVTAVPPTKADSGLLATTSLETAPAPTFSRASNDDSTPWTLDIDATLRRTSWAGNALFILYDAEDGAAIENREVTALYQMRIPAS